MRLRNNWLLPLVLLGGCTKAPEQVSIDLTQIDQAQTITLPGESITVQGAQGRSETIEPLPEISLYQDLTEGDREAIEETLLKSRQDALERALRSLRRQYQSQVDAEREAVTVAIQEADEADWASTTQDLRAIFDRYAPEEGRLQTSILALDRAKRNPTVIPSLRTELEDALRQIPDENVEEWKARLATLQAQFQEEITPVLTAYQVRKAGREAVPDQIAEELTRQFEAEAQQQAAQIVETTFQEAFDFDAVLSETVAPAPGADVSEPARTAQRTTLPGVETTPPDDPAWEAQLFVEAKGYKLSKPGLGVRDATEEFKEWRKQYALGR